MSLPAQFWWWVARASGMVAWGTATAAMAWGLLLSGRLVRRRQLPSWLLDLHRYLGTLTVAFLALHLVGLVADSWSHFGAADLFVPMASSWRPGAVAWGILALYGLMVIELTSWSMRLLARPVWHTIHLSSFGVFVAATVHGALSGADRNNPLAQILLVSGVTVVVLLTVMRLLEQGPGAPSATSRAEQIMAARAALAGRSRAVVDAAATASAPLVPTTPAEWAAHAADWAANAAAEPRADATGDQSSR